MDEINELLIENTAYFNCNEITDEDIKDLVDVLPKINLIQFIEASLVADYILIDYEDQDKIYYCYSEEECINILKTIREKRDAQ